MIVWGSGGDVINIGSQETRNCEVCEKDRPFNVVLQYRYWGLYWVFNCITKKEYMLLCDICQRGWNLEKSKVEGSMDSVPIPFMRRFGLLLLLGIIVGFAIFGSVRGAR